jgi:tRNA threonylcarbamoyladenosine biosynthesis protein TsaE
MTTPEPPRTLAVETRSAEESRRLARAVSPLLVPGDVLVLSGDLGAGKTTFVQGLAAGLGVPERIVSPTFILMKEYLGGRYPLMHLDVYRLGRIQELIDLGYDDFLEPSAVIVVEWGDMVEPLLPRDHLLVELKLGQEATDRTVTLTPKGPGWESRMQTLRILANELFSPAREADPGYVERGGERNRREEAG